MTAALQYEPRLVTTWTDVGCADAPCRLEIDWDLNDWDGTRYAIYASRLVLRGEDGIIDSDAAVDILHVRCLLGLVNSARFEEVRRKLEDFDDKQAFEVEPCEWELT